MCVLFSCTLALILPKVGVKCNALMQQNQKRRISTMRHAVPTSVAAAIKSDSLSKSITCITPTKGVNRHSPVAGFIIAHRFVTGKHKTEQTIACSVSVCDPKSEVVRSVRGHDRSIPTDALIMYLRLSQGTFIIDRKIRRQGGCSDEDDRDAY